MLKKELRKIYIEKRKSLSEEDRRRQSEAIADRFFANSDLAKINFLHCFLSIEKFGEIDTKLILERLWREFPQIQTVVPRINRQKDELESLLFAPETVLVQNNWQIHEPAHDETIESALIDLVIVPLLCFDTSGFRVGYGKGYYDKFLSSCRPDCLKIGISYFAPVDKIEDVHEFDVKLDFCVTPEEIWKF